MGRKESATDVVPISDDELAAMEARAAAATPGPWQSWIEGRDFTSGSSVIRTGVVARASCSDIELVGGTDADQDFIAHARQDVPRLVAEVRRLRAAAARLRRKTPGTGE